MSGIKWTLLALIGCGLLAFGYKVNMDQSRSPQEISRGPISVAAVRGGAEALPSEMAPASNSFVDYTKSLQDDVSLARANVKKYEAGARSEANSSNEQP